MPEASSVTRGFGTRSSGRQLGRGLRHGDAEHLGECHNELAKPLHHITTLNALGDGRSEERIRGSSSRADASANARRLRFVWSVTKIGPPLWERLGRSHRD